jgi:peptidoglycan hydrolase-like protein with peptidoglycan-binding domain
MTPLRRGLEGADVRALQVALNLKTISRLPVSGRYDAATETAVERAQRELRLPATGTADEALLDALGLLASGGAVEGVLPW